MGSRLSVYRLVASHLGQDEEILDPSDETKLTRAIASVWDAARRMSLRKNNWNFAGKRVAINPEEEPPAFGYSFAFRKPDDFVRLADVDGPMPQDRDWKFEGGYILANSAPLQVLYIYDCTDVAMWDDLFEMAISLKIAELVALNITGSQSLSEICARKFAAMFSDAQQIDATENPPQEFDMDPWLVARGAYTSPAYHP